MSRSQIWRVPGTQQLAVRSTGLRQTPEQRLRAMMRNPRPAVALSPDTRPVPARVMRASGSAKAIPTLNRVQVIERKLASLPEAAREKLLAAMVAGYA